MSTSYIDELQAGHPCVLSNRVPRHLLDKACREVDSLRLQLARALETGVKSMSMGEAELRRELAKALEDAERAKGENGALHGKIGLMAERLLGISNNLPTDETLGHIEAGFNAHAMRLERMEMTHNAFDADMVDFMQRVQNGEVTCIRAAQVINAKIRAAARPGASGGGTAG